MQAIAGSSASKEERDGRRVETLQALWPANEAEGR